MKYRYKQNSKQQTMREHYESFATSIVIQKTKPYYQRFSKAASLRKNIIPKVNIEEKTRKSQQMYRCPLRKLSQGNLESSTLHKLKKEAEKLERDEEGQFQRFSTLENPAKHKQNIMFMTINKMKKINPRKVAKGRPEIYNWVRKNNKKMAKFQDDYRELNDIRKNKSPKMPVKSVGGTFLERLKRIEEMKKISHSQLKLCAKMRKSSNEMCLKVKTEF